MRALIKGEEPNIEVYPEDCWSIWTRNHLDWEIEINEWTLIDPYEPE